MISIVHELDSTRKLTEISTWIFVSFFAIVTIFYLSQLYLLQLPLRGARQMLVLIPQPLLIRHIALQGALRNMVSDLQRSAVGTTS